MLLGININRWRNFLKVLCSLALETLKIRSSPDVGKWRGQRKRTQERGTMPRYACITSSPHSTCTLAPLPHDRHASPSSPDLKSLQRQFLWQLKLNVFVQSFKLWWLCVRYGRSKLWSFSEWMIIFFLRPFWWTFKTLPILLWPGRTLLVFIEIGWKTDPPVQMQDAIASLMNCFMCVCPLWFSTILHTLISTYRRQFYRKTMKSTYQNKQTKNTIQFLLNLVPWKK